METSVMCIPSNLTFAWICEVHFACQWGVRLRLRDDSDNDAHADSLFVLFLQALVECGTIPYD